MENILLSTFFFLLDKSTTYMLVLNSLMRRGGAKWVYIANENMDKGFLHPQNMPINTHPPSKTH